MERKIEWMTGKGPAAVTVTLVTERVIDDNLGITKPCCEIEIKAKSPVGTTIGHPIRKAQVVGGIAIAATIGKLAIRPEQMALIDAAIDEIKATPEWIAYQTKQAQGATEVAEIEAGRETMRRVMGY